MTVADRVRALFLALPEITERPSHGAPAWFVRNKTSVGTLWLHGHHDLDRPHLWAAAPPGAQEQWIAMDPRRYFRPPYVGHRGWIGVYLDGRVDWDELAEIIDEAFQHVAPAALVRSRDAHTDK